MSTPGDRIDEYLRALRASLRTTPQETERIVAEAEDHLREAAAAAMAAGLTQTEAEEAAISSFGSVRAVVRAHVARHGKGALLTSLVMTGWKLAWTCLLAAGGVSVVAFIFDLTAGRSFVSAPRPGTRFAASQCRYWMHVNPGAHTCAQAFMLEGSSDIVTAGAFCAIAGAVLLECYHLVHVLQRRRGREIRNVLPRAFFPTVAATAFGAAGLYCYAAAALTAARAGGPGAWLSGAIVCAVLAAANMWRLRGTSLPRPPSLAQLRWPKPGELARRSRRRLRHLRSASGRPFVPRAVPARWTRRVHQGLVMHAPARALRRRRRHAVAAYRRRRLRKLWFPRMISLPRGRRLERRVYLFWRVRLPLWVVLAVAGWLVLGIPGVAMGLAVAIMAEMAVSYRLPRGIRPGRGPGDLAGVREPRRPRPSGGAAAAQLPLDTPSPWMG